MAGDVVNKKVVTEVVTVAGALQKANIGAPNGGGGGGFGLSIVCDGNAIFTYGSGAGGGIRQVQLGHLVALVRHLCCGVNEHRGSCQCVCGMGCSVGSYYRHGGCVDRRNCVGKASVLMPLTPPSRPLYSSPVAVVCVYASVPPACCCTTVTATTAPPAAQGFQFRSVVAAVASAQVSCELLKCCPMIGSRSESGWLQVGPLRSTRNPWIGTCTQTGKETTSAGRARAPPSHTPTRTHPRT